MFFLFEPHGVWKKKKTAQWDFASIISLRKKCPYSELLWSAFFHIRTEYGEIQSISPYSVQMRKKTDQNNSEYEHFSRSIWI